MNSSPPPEVRARRDWPSVHAILGAWYAAHGRDLPWRRTRDPYAILVSEVMLQQTQVDRTIPKYHEFLKLFPTLEALAKAPLADVIRSWSGMGYNGRAVRLHRLAAEVVTNHGGQLPSAVPDLIALPGIGPYTAAAVACFAFGAPVPVLDTNIYRVLSRFLHGVTPPTKRAIEDDAAEAMPQEPGAAWSWNQALMDIGATLCTVTKPRCMLCPLRPDCAAAPVLQSGAPRAVAEASVPYTAKQAKFAGSTRYYRGRIIDALRAASPDAPVPLAALGARIREDYDPSRDDAWLAGLVDGLARDGLAKRHSVDGGADAVSLP